MTALTFYSSPECDRAERETKLTAGFPFKARPKAVNDSDRTPRDGEQLWRADHFLEGVSEEKIEKQEGVLRI